MSIASAMPSNHKTGSQVIQPYTLQLGNRSPQKGSCLPWTPAGQRPSKRLLLQVWGSTYYTLLPSSPPNPKLNHGESTRTLQLRRKMPKKLDHVQLRSKHTPRLVGTGGQTAQLQGGPGRIPPWHAQQGRESDTHFMSVVCQVEQEHVPGKDVVSRRVGTSANPWSMGLSPLVWGLSKPKEMRDPRQVISRPVQQTASWPEQQKQKLCSKSSRGYPAKGHRGQVPDSLPAMLRSTDLSSWLSCQRFWAGVGCHLSQARGRGFEHGQQTAGGHFTGSCTRHSQDRGGWGQRKQKKRLNGSRTPETLCFQEGHSRIHRN